jgi:hypothetical protein
VSRHEYEVSKALVRMDPPFFALIMAAMRTAGTGNHRALQLAFPEVWKELQARYDAPGGVLAGDP